MTAFHTPSEERTSDDSRAGGFRSGRPGVEDVQDEQKLFDKLFLVLNRATLLAGGLALVMLLAAVLLITTTIRLSALSRRRGRSSSTA